MEKVLFCWSGGKDSAISLYEIQKSQKYEILALLTTITSDYDRVSMHGVPRTLVERQAHSLGLPLEKISISKDCSNEEYDSKMREILIRFKQAGVSSVVFGDIFLKGVRKYREDNLSELPPDVDPAGENGEFHSFVFDGPIFKKRIGYTLGEQVLRDSFYFRDLLPEGVDK